MRGPAHWCACLGLALSLLATAQEPVAEPPSTPAEARARIEALNRAIAEIRSALQAARSEYASEQRSLEALDLQIQDSARRLRELRAQQAEQEAELARLADERDAQLQRLAVDHEQLARRLVAAWRLGRQSRIQLILNQDSPARLDRTLAYYEYLTRAQAERMTALRAQLAGLERVAADTTRALAALAELEGRHAATAAGLQADRAQRQALVAKLDRQINSDQARLEELTRNRADLEQLLETLANALADIPADLDAGVHPRRLRGELPMPVNGRVLTVFGQARGAGLHWRGWVIAAQPGAEVRAVAYGRVAYADWLRGYGLLAIIDHGDGFMSLYGHNEALLFEVGDWVQGGEAIATAGHGGPPGGVYFELRSAGQAVDPAAWVRRR